MFRTWVKCSGNLLTKYHNSILIGEVMDGTGSSSVGRITGLPC